MTNSWAAGQLQWLSSLTDKYLLQEGLSQSESSLYTQESQHAPSHEWLMLSPITFGFTQGPQLTSAQQHGWMSFNKMLAGCSQIGRASPVGGDGAGERGGRWLMPNPSRKRGCGASRKAQRGWIIHSLTFSKQFSWWSQIRNCSKWL